MTAIDLELPEHEQLERAASLLASSRDFRVLRRFLPPRRYRPEPTNALLASGLYVDVETTGLDVEHDRVIELAMVPFDFDDAGNVYGVSIGFAQVEDPGVPIPPEIAKLTGLTDDAVRGQHINQALVDGWIAQTELVIAHNAEFDRKVLERRFPAFAHVDWACSYREVPWAEMGCLGAKLPHLLAEACSGFYDAHRALDDCLVGVHVLATAQHDGKSALAHLLASARRASARIWATHAHFHVKDRLKARKYRWAPEPVKCWYLDVADDLAFYSDKDFLVEVNWSAWRLLSGPQRVALIDHELCHFSISQSEKGDTLKTILGHDVEEFHDIVSRWGLWHAPLKMFANHARNAPQFDLFVLAGGAEVDDEAGRD